MKLIILDRDGVINDDADEYIKSEQEWKPIPGSLEAIARLTLNDYRVIVVSNQSGIGRGLFSIEDLNKIHRKMLTHLSQFGGVIEAIFFCPHVPEDNCHCRKPAIGLLEDIQSRLRVSLHQVYFIGDKLADIQAAQAIYARPILLRTGKGQGLIEQNLVADDIEIHDDLASAVTVILRRH